MVTCLSTLTNLKELSFEFDSPFPLPPRQSRHSAVATYCVLGVLTHFEFQGFSEYLEDLVARLDTAKLDGLRIPFFYQLIVDPPRLVLFINRTPRFKAIDGASVLAFPSTLEDLYI
jgi:hypothetical protein